MSKLLAKNMTFWANSVHTGGKSSFDPMQCDQKNRQMSIKVAQNDFTRKINDFDTFTKIA